MEDNKAAVAIDVPQERDEPVSCKNSRYFQKSLSFLFTYLIPNKFIFGTIAICLYYLYFVGIGLIYPPECKHAANVSKWLIGAGIIGFLMVTSVATYLKSKIERKNILADIFLDVICFLITAQLIWVVCGNVWMINLNKELLNCSTPCDQNLKGKLFRYFFSVNLNLHSLIFYIAPIIIILFLVKAGAIIKGLMIGVYLLVLSWLCKPWLFIYIGVSFLDKDNLSDGQKTIIYLSLVFSFLVGIIFLRLFFIFELKICIRFGLADNRRNTYLNKLLQNATNSLIFESTIFLLGVVWFSDIVLKSVF